MSAASGSNHFTSANTIQALRETREIHREQPRPIEPLTFESQEPPPSSQHSHRASQWIADGRSFASRASNRASVATRRNVRRRPTIESIGAPYDFKKVELPQARTPGFRPLTLSIHLPGNELPPLPEFDEALLEDTTLTFPAPALTKSRSDPMLSRRPSTAFSIPRKPVPSRAVSMDFPRSSIDSRYTLNETVRPSQSLHRRPSIAPSHTTQDLLDTLEARLPQSPPLARSKSGPEPVYTLYRKASDQSLRLRTHLEERQQLERRFPECDTIMEDKEGDFEKSPILTRLTGPELLGEDETPAAQVPGPNVAELQEVIRQRPRAPSTRTRISQWLMRANPASLPYTAAKCEEPAQLSFYALRPSSTNHRTSVSSSVYSMSSTAADPTVTAWTTPRSSPHRKGSSLSSCQTMGLSTLSARDPSLDVEKHPMPVVVDVGVAF